MKLKELLNITSKISSVDDGKYFIRFIRFVAVFSIAIGCLALLIPLAVLDGFHKELRLKTMMFASHITVKTFNNTPIKNKDILIQNIFANYEEVLNIEANIRHGALLKTGDITEGIIIRGVAETALQSRFAEYIIKGKIDFSQSNNIVISQSIARKCKLDTGSSVFIFSVEAKKLSENKLPKIEKFKVSGIYSTGLAQYDDVISYISLNKAQSFFDFKNNEVSNLDIFIDKPELSPALALELDKFLGYPHYTLSVFDLHQALYNWIDLQREPIPIVLGLISIVAVFNIISILLILVMEKTHTIGILRALGLTANEVKKIFIYRGLSLAIKGIIIGIGLAFTLSILQKTIGLISLDPDIYYLDTVPVDIQVWHYILVIFTTLFMSFFASYIPAKIAGKVSPIRAIRYK